MARLICIDDDVPAETISLLRAASERRNVAFEIIDAAGFDYLPERRLSVGDLLYCPATSQRAGAVERYLYGPGVVGLRTDPLGPFAEVGGAPTLFERNGLPTPRHFPVGAVTPRLLNLIVDELGGFPVVVKVPGGSGGIGVMRADSMPALKSLLEFLLAKGVLPFVSSYVPDAVCWRVIVVGDRALVACRNPVPDGDFRSRQSSRKEDYFSEVSADIASLAINAVKSLRIEFGGIDLLEHQSGRLYLLEVNFPCYFAPADLVGGLDVSGALIDYMLAKHRDTKRLHQSPAWPS
jgi:hypothetical protein